LPLDVSLILLLVALTVGSLLYIEGLGKL